MRVDLRANDRTLLVGKTGSGKTTLGLHLFDAFAGAVRILVDPKDEWKLRQRYGAGVPTLDAATIRRAAPGDLLRVVPAPEAEACEAVFAAVFEARRACLVYVDELALVTRGPHSYPESLRRLYTQGRSRGVGIIAGTQRPVSVPPWCVTEAEHVFCFRLSRREDRDVLSRGRGEDFEAVAQLPDHGFAYSGPAGGLVICRPLEVR